ncbi:hypothetical protein COBT_001016 [Conglomerata obtusa]
MFLVFTCARILFIVANITLRHENISKEERKNHCVQEIPVIGIYSICAKKFITHNARGSGDEIRLVNEASRVLYFYILGEDEDGNLVLAPQKQHFHRDENNPIALEYNYRENRLVLNEFAQGKNQLFKLRLIGLNRYIIMVNHDCLTYNHETDSIDVTACKNTERDTCLLFDAFDKNGLNKYLENGKHSSDVDYDLLRYFKSNTNDRNTTAQENIEFIDDKKPSADNLVEQEIKEEEKIEAQPPEEPKEEGSQPAEVQHHAPRKSRWKKFVDKVFSK